MIVGRYGCPAIEHIWSEEAKYQLWLEIEMAYLSQIFREPLRAPKLNIKAIKQIEDRSKHDVAAFVEWLEGALKRTKLKKNSRYVHFGLTSSDIVDTAFAMQIRDTERQLRSLVFDLIRDINKLAESAPEIRLTGRTHGQAAEWYTLQAKLRGYNRVLNFLIPDTKPVGKMSGSLGDYRHMAVGERSGIKLSEHTLSKLGLTNDLILTQGQIVSRAYHAQVMNGWALIACEIEKIATDLRLMAQTEVWEFSEKSAPGQMGSSSMPHKRNPVGLENLCGIARVMRGYASVAMENINLWHERDISHSAAERIIFPQGATLLGYMTQRLSDIFRTGTFHVRRMSDNIQDNAKLTYMCSQVKMNQFIDRGVSRKQAHREVSQIGNLHGIPHGS